MQEFRSVVSFELHERKHIDHQLIKTVRRELRHATRSLTESTGAEIENAVHESRKSLKKVRAVVALLERADAKPPRKDRKRLKSAANALATLRDGAAIIETFDRLRHRYPKRLSEHTYGILRRGLVGARDREQARAQRDGTIDEAVERLAATRKSAKHWPSSSVSVSDVCAIVAASYGRSRTAMRRARGTGRSATLHRWRKELKTLWYQLRLVKPLTTGVAPLVADLKRLETELGDDHNLVILAATLRACGDLRTMSADIRQIDRVAARMRQFLRRRAFALGRRLHHRSPKAFASWIRGLAKRGRQTAAA